MSLFLTLALSVLTGLRDALSIGWEWLTAKPSRIVVAVLVGLCAFLCWRLSAIDGDRDGWRTRAEGYEAAAKAVAEANEKASAIGIVTAAEVRKDIDDANERAREAAARSDDPLRAGLDRLRAEKDRSRH